jgi:hypothetical protein
MSSIIVILIITAFVILNVLFSRYMNRIMYKKDEWDIHPELWFIPVIPWFLLCLGFIGFYFKQSKIVKWFNCDDLKKHE